MISSTAITPEPRDVLPLLNNQMMISFIAITLELRDASLLLKKLNQMTTSSTAIPPVPRDALPLPNWTTH